MNTLGNTLVGAVVVLSLVALGWVIVPAIKDGRMPSGDGTALSPASPIEPAPQSRPSGLQSHFAGER